MSSSDSFTPKSGVPTGKAFSQVYVAHGEATADSPKMRHRIASSIDSVARLDHFFKLFAETELGIPTPWSTPSRSWAQVIERWPISDVLDLVTVAYRYIHGRDAAGAKMWVARLNRIFEETNVHYRIDSDGGVHFFFDAEFARAAAATIAILGEPRHANSLHLFENAINELSHKPPLTKEAIRGTFNALEGLFKLMFPDEPRLVAGKVSRLDPLIAKLYAADDTALKASRKMLSSFGDWIDAAHFYRHEQGSEEVAQPPISMAILMISNGAAFLRWLAEIHTASQA